MDKHNDFCISSYCRLIYTKLSEILFDESINRGLDKIIMMPKKCTLLDNSVKITSIIKYRVVCFTLIIAHNFYFKKIFISFICRKIL